MGRWAPGNSAGPGSKALKSAHERNRAFRQYIDEHHPAALRDAITITIKTMLQGESERIRFEAAQALLDRYFGRPPVALSIDNEGGGATIIQVIRTMIGTQPEVPDVPVTCREEPPPDRESEK
jgi:hypothetical protein